MKVSGSSCLAKRWYLSTGVGGQVYCHRFAIDSESSRRQWQPVPRPRPSRPRGMDALRAINSARLRHTQLTVAVTCVHRTDLSFERGVEASVRTLVSAVPASTAATLPTLASPANGVASEGPANWQRRLARSFSHASTRTRSVPGRKLRERPLQRLGDGSSLRPFWSAVSHEIDQPVPERAHGKWMTEPAHLAI